MCQCCYGTSAAQGSQVGFLGERGREKLLEICADTVGAMLKVSLCCIINVLSLWNKCISRFWRRFKPDPLSETGLPLTWTTYRLLPQIILHNRPTLRLPFITKEKKIPAVCTRWGGNSTINVGYRKAIGSCMNSRNNRRETWINQKGGRHLLPNSVIVSKCRASPSVCSLNRKLL